MEKRTVKTSHKSIFEYWKDKAITKDGDVIREGEDFKNSIPVVYDYGEPECWACRQKVEILEQIDISKVWGNSKVKSKLNRCHIIPYSASGEDEPSNLFLLCEDCHINSPDTNNQNNFLRWVYKRRIKGLTVNGFIINEFIEEFLEDCNDKNKNPQTLNPRNAKIFSHNGKCSQSTLVMALSDTWDNIRSA